jgi:tetratricopeptide (TPR) repeat protein
MNKESKSRLRTALGEGLPAHGRNLITRVKQRPALTALVFAGIVVAGGVILGRKSIARLFAAQGVTELSDSANDDPKSPDRWLALGHALFQQGRHAEALQAYDRALSVDANVADEQLRTNVAACFGQKEQPAAAALIVQHQLRPMQPRLVQLSRSRVYRVRWGALNTLEKLGLASRVDYVGAWTRDLEVPDCEVRRRATEKLGAQGDLRSIAALRAAKHKDQESTPWYRRSCLGSRPADAEKSILGRSEHHAEAQPAGGARRPRT